MKLRLFVTPIALLFLISFFDSPTDASTYRIELYDTDNLFSENAGSSTNGIEQSIVDYINTSAVSIEFFVYSLRSDDITDALCLAVDRGVNVRTVAESDNMGANHVMLESCGVSVVYDSRSALQHIKAIVVDGGAVFFGSQNFTDSGLNHDNGIMIEVHDTCIASKFAEEFEQLYAGEFRSNAPTTDHTCSTPFGEWHIYFPPNDAEAEAVVSDAINNATSTIAYGSFVTTRWSTRDALIDASNSGVEVFAIFDAHQASQGYSATHDLVSAGVEVSVDIFGGQWHHKNFVVDAHSSNPVSVVGSTNFSTSGFTSNNELLIAIEGDNIIARWLHRVITSAYTTLPETAKNETQPVNGEAGRYACNDGIDNDYDGYIDAIDFDCRESYEEECNDGINNNDFDSVLDSADVDCHWYEVVIPGVYVDYVFPDSIVVGWLYGQFELHEIYFQDINPFESSPMKPAEHASFLGETSEGGFFIDNWQEEGWFVVCREGGVCGAAFSGDPSPQPNK